MSEMIICIVAQTSVCDAALTGCCWTWNQKLKCVPLFSGDEWLVIECCPHRVPRQRGAFHTHRKVAHAGENSQPTQLVWRGPFIQLAGDHAVKFAKQGFGFFPALALYRLRHHA